MTKEAKSNYKAIGVMAGSSMDGLDLAYVSLSQNDTWAFELIESRSVSYPKKIYEMLLKASISNVKDQETINEDFGYWIADQVKKLNPEDCDFIAVHGHTLLHDLERRVSWQLGKAKVISEETNLPVISDFRTLDLKLGGQGAPLVPRGDFELFSEYDACINLGGIANVSVRDSGLAWDIGPCNQVFNYFAKKLGFEYDDEGKLARQGRLNVDWLNGVERLAYFSTKPPKALINNYIPQEVLDQVDPTDGIHTYVSFLSDQIKSDLSKQLPSEARILLTGGGAYNSYLIEQLKSGDHQYDFAIPTDEIIDFKEAIVFAFLGALRMCSETNVLASVTGASRDSSSGVIHYPK